MPETESVTPVTVDALKMHAARNGCSTTCYYLSTCSLTWSSILQASTLYAKLYFAYVSS